MAAARILLVDDEPAVRMVLEHTLKRQGYIVNAVESGEDALSLIEQHSFDLLLLDWKLPGIDGVALARRVRQRQPAVPIVILTGSVPLHSSDHAPEPDEFPCLHKTAHPERVLEQISELLSAARPS